MNLVIIKFKILHKSMDSDPNFTRSTFRNSEFSEFNTKNGKSWPNNPIFWETPNSDPISNNFPSTVFILEHRMPKIHKHDSTCCHVFCLFLLTLHYVMCLPMVTKCTVYSQFCLCHNIFLFFIFHIVITT